MSVLRELAGGKEHPLRGKVTLIGRDPACDVVVRMDQASFRHAIIVQAGSSYSIEDLESVNGVYVNGTRIRGRTALRPGDRIEIPGFAASLQTTGTPVPAPRDGVTTTVLMSGGGRIEIKPDVKLRAVLEILRYLEHGARPQGGSAENPGVSVLRLPPGRPRFHLAPGPQHRAVRSESRPQAARAGR